jgi:hypothetical protein
MKLTLAHGDVKGVGSSSMASNRCQDRTEMQPSSARTPRTIPGLGGLCGREDENDLRAAARRPEFMTKWSAIGAGSRRGKAVKARPTGLTYRNLSSPRLSIRWTFQVHCLFADASPTSRHRNRWREPEGQPRRRSVQALHAHMPGIILLAGRGFAIASAVACQGR